MKLNEEQFKAFAMEIATFGNIPISSQPCGVGCVFCKVNCDSKLNRFPAIPKIDEEDLLKGFKYIPKTVKNVRLGAGVLVAPHTDPYLHPSIYDFIKLTSEHFPDRRICTVSTGSYIDEDKISFLNGIKNFGIDLSLLTLQECREKLMAMPTRDKVMHILREAPLNKVTLMFTGVLDELKRDLELLYRLNVHERVRQILVRRIEHTKESNDRLLEISRRCIAGYEKAVEFLNRNYPEVVFTVPMLKDCYRGGGNEYFIDAENRIAELKTVFARHQGCRICVVCAESGYEYFSNALANIPHVTTHLVRNRLYGGSVTVAGLLNHRDIEDQFRPADGFCDMIILPREMYNADDCDITGESRRELERFYHAEVCAI